MEINTKTQTTIIFEEEEFKALIAALGYLCIDVGYSTIPKDIQEHMHTVVGIFNIMVGVV